MIFKRVFIAFLLVFTLIMLNGQSQLGLKLGVSSYDLPSNMLNLDGEELKLSIEQANYGFHFGIYGRVKLLGFHIQPEINFNSNSVQYRVDDINTNGTVNELITESYQNIDIPILLMIKPFIFNVYAGPVGHYFLHSSSKLKDFEGIKEEFNTLSYGYQAGVGVQLWGISLDVRYEGNFSNFGDHIVFKDHSYEFSNSPSRFLFS